MNSGEKIDGESESSMLPRHVSADRSSFGKFHTRISKALPIQKTLLRHPAVDEECSTAPRVTSILVRTAAHQLFQTSLAPAAVPCTLASTRGCAAALLEHKHQLAVSPTQLGLPSSFPHFTVLSLLIVHSRLNTTFKPLNPSFSCTAQRIAIRKPCPITPSSRLFRSTLLLRGCSIRMALLV